MTMTTAEIVSAFERFMCEVGIVPAWKRGQGIEFGMNARGKPHRFQVEGERVGSKNGGYVLFGDGIPAGRVWNWKTGANHTWRAAGDGGRMTAEEIAALDARIEADRKTRQAETRAREGEAAREANLLWNAAAPVGGDAHPYLQRKGITSRGLRVGDWPIRASDGQVIRTIKDALLIPIMSNKGRIVSLQAIFPARDARLGRDKDFLRDGRKQGCFFLIGTPPPAGGTVALVEGYATGASVHHATGWCVAVCWDAYNLPRVAKQLRDTMPNVEFVFAADNDRWTLTPVENPGVTYAKRAAHEYGGRVAIPEFDDLGNKPTDFNDLHLQEGIEAVQDALLPARDVAVGSGATTAAPPPACYQAPLTDGSVDVATPMVDVDGKGKPLPTPSNLDAMLRRLGVVARYNTIAKEVETIIPGSCNTVDNAAAANVAELLGWCARFRMSTANFDANLLAVADANPYNPVATWIESRAWDGRTRLPEFYATITAKADAVLPSGESLKCVLMRKWMLSAVAAAYEPNGVVARGVLTFQSKQAMGKTKWVKRLAPPELDVVADGLGLNPDDRDSVKQSISKWIVELGEVDSTFRKADLAALKRFISRQRDTLRLPYARSESKYPRRTVFFASVNPERYLKDETGNTRYWTINIEAMNADHAIDMQQLWAEIKATLYDRGETWHLTHDETIALNSHNTRSEEINPLHELIDRQFRWDTPRDAWTVPRTATEIAHDLGIKAPTKRDINEIAAYVESEHGAAKRKHGKLRTQVLMVPQRIDDGRPW